MPLVQPLQIQVEDVYHHRQVNEVALFGRELTDAEYGHLAGICIDGVVLRVVFDVELGGAPCPLRLHARREDVVSSNLFFQPGVVIMDSIFVGEQQRKTHLGWKIFFHQARTAASFNFVSMRAKALRIPAGDWRGMHDGYYAAARWGFNATLTDGIKAKLPAELAGATSLVDLVETPVAHDFRARREKLLTLSSI